MKAPWRIGTSGSTVYGAIAVATDYEAPKNVAEVFLNGKITTLPIAFPAGPHGGPMQITGMYVRKGNFVCFVDEIFTGQYIYGSYLYEISPDGTIVDSKEYGTSDYRFTFMAYDPTKDMIYGYLVINETLYYGTASGSNPLDVTLDNAVTPADWPMAAITFNQVNNKLIGIAGSTVVEIDTATGVQSKIGTIDTPSEYITGMAYSPYDQGYFYAVATDAANGIQLLDENDFSTLSYQKYDSLIGYYNLFCPDLQAVTESAPGEASIVNTIFANGALNGSITYLMPSATYGGTAILGNIDWILEIDGKEYKRGSAAAGSEVTVEITGLSEGMHTFNFKTALGGNFGPFLIHSFYLGNDTPCAPANVTLTDSLISWDAVTTGVNGGYVNAEEVVYNVYVNDSPVALGISATECSPKLPTGTLLDSYVASVEAIFNGKTSELASSGDLNYGDPYPLPEQFAPTAKESKLFTIVDANGDDNTINFVQMNFGALGTKDVFVYTTHTRNAANDWLYLPITNYDDAQAVYEFSMNAMRGSTKAESIEVVLATAPDGQTSSVVGTIVPTTSLNNNPSDVQASLLNYVKGTFTVPAAGNYYVGVCVKSARNRDRVIMRDFSVAKIENMAVTHPKAVTGLTAKAAPQGELKADVSFTFPTANIAGTDYAADKTLSAVVKAEGCEAVTVSGTPGGNATASVPANQGNNSVTVTVADGDLIGLPASVSVYVGVEPPATVNNLIGTVDPSDFSMHLTWEAPTAGVNGGYIRPEGISYYLLEYKFDGKSYNWEIVDDLGEDVTEYDYTLPSDAPIQLVQLGILTENFAGRSTTFRVAANVMGTPYPIPTTYNFTATGTPQNPTVNYSSDDVTLVVGNPADDYNEYATDDNLKALYTMSYFDVTDGFFTLPKFSTKGSVNAGVSLNVYGGSTSSFSITASTSGIDRKVVKTFAASDFEEKGPQKVVVDLPAEFQGKDWVEVGILYNTTYSWFGDSEVFILYGYTFFDDVPYDFGVTAIEGNTLAKIGEENMYVAHVTNLGNTANAVPASNWKLTDAEGNTVTNVDLPAGTEEIAPGDEITFNISFIPTADQLGQYNLAYTLIKADNKEFNDAMDKQIEVVKGIVPVVTDLHATEITFSNVTLGWSPISTSKSLVEDFEEETPLVLDGESDMVAGFKRIDGDGQMVYGPNSSAYQQLPTANQPQSFVVWSQTDMEQIMKLGDNSPYKAASGDKFLIAFCPGPDSNGKAANADDWLISPEIAGGSTFSFAMKPLTYLYGAETVEILYSSTGTAEEDFTLLETIKTPVGEGSPTFEEYDFALPEDAKYVAIHYVSNDVFGIIIDDIGYTPASSELKLSGFDIYRNGVLLAGEQACPDNSYDDTTVEEDKEYSYTIVPILSDGTKGVESNTLVLRTSGVGTIDAEASEDAEYFNLNGVRITGKPEPGIYLMKQGDKVNKVVITK